MTDQTLEAIIKLKDEISKPLNNIQNEMRDLNKTSNDINRAMNDVQKATGDAGNDLKDLKDATQDTNETLRDTNEAASQAATSIIGMGLQQAGQQMQEFGQKILDVIGNLTELATTSETSFAKVNSILGLGDKAFQNYKKELKNGANDLGMTYADYADSAYNAISAGVSKENVTSFLSQANQLAKGGLTELEGATDLLTTIQNAYGMTQKDMAHVSDVLIQTQNKGKEFCSVDWKQAA